MDTENILNLRNSIIRNNKYTNYEKEIKLLMTYSSCVQSIDNLAKHEQTRIDCTRFLQS